MIVGGGKTRNYVFGGCKDIDIRNDDVLVGRQSCLSLVSRLSGKIFTQLRIPKEDLYILY